MTSFPQFANRSMPRKSQGRAFTLIELLAVMAIMTVMMVSVGPAINAINGEGTITKAAYDIAGALEQARAYAMAHNTYVWVGFIEEDASSPSPSTPVNASGSVGGRVIISVVASADGTRYNITDSNPPAFGTSTNTTKLVQLSKLIKLENVHMGTLNDGIGSSNTPSRPAVAQAYQVGDPGFAQHYTSSSASLVQNQTTFKYPLKGNQYTFSKIIEFNPQGGASKIVDGVINGPQQWLEIGLQPTHGKVIDARYIGTSKADSAVMIEGVTGRTEIVRL